MRQKEKKITKWEKKGIEASHDDNRKKNSPRPLTSQKSKSPVNSLFSANPARNLLIPRLNCQEA